MRITRQVFSLFMFISVFTSLAFAEERCKSNIRLIAILDDSESAINLSYTDVENSSEPIDFIDSGSSLTFSKPRDFYKKVNVQAKVTDGESNSEIAFISHWPCLVNKPIPLYISDYETTISALRELWSSEIFNSKDHDTAAQEFFNAYSLAQWRLTSFPDSKRQYDLISTYLALRAFNNLITVLETPIYMTSGMKKIYHRHKELLKVVNPNGLDVIFNEKDKLGTEESILENLYRRAWSNILKIEDPGVAFEAGTRFLKSIREESDTDGLLERIHLSENVIITSTSNRAGKLFRSRKISSNELILDDRILEQLTSHNEENEKLLASSNASERQKRKIQKDNTYLKSEIRAYKKVRGQP